jgi:hypothetical protein
VLAEELASLAIVAGDEAQEGWGLVSFYMHCCTVLIEADLAGVNQEELEQFVFVAFQRRQDRFPRTPILSPEGIYATRA